MRFAYTDLVATLQKFAEENEGIREIQNNPVLPARALVSVFGTCAGFFVARFISGMLL